ncbi:MAG: efflux RND transporter periplasmic adaptor subunit [Acidobacteriota bacterium]
MSLRTFLICGALCWGAAVAPFTGAQSEPAPPRVAVAAVEAGGVGEPLWVPATVVSRRDATLSSEVAGSLVEVAEVGDRLRRGDVIARVDDSLLRLELRSSEAEVARLEARLAYVGKQVERAQALTAEQITSRRALEELEAEHVMAGHELEAARVRRDTTRHHLRRATLKAPFPGVLAERHTEPGSYVAVGQEVARLVDLERVEASAMAPVRTAPWVSADASLRVRGNGEHRTGRLRATVPVADVRSRSFELRIALEDSPWPVGAAVSVAIPQSAAGASPDPTVPRDALLLRRDATWVWVLDGDVVRRVDVIPGADAGPRLHVRADGLQIGDRVVIRGGESLSDGQTVRLLTE